MKHPKVVIFHFVQSKLYNLICITFEVLVKLTKSYNLSRLTNLAEITFLLRFVLHRDETTELSQSFHSKYPNLSLNGLFDGRR